MMKAEQEFDAFNVWQKVRVPAQDGIVIMRSRLLNIQEFCELIVKSFGVCNLPWGNIYTTETGYKMGLFLMSLQDLLAHYRVLQGFPKGWAKILPHIHEE